MKRISASLLLSLGLFSSAVSAEALDPYAPKTVVLRDVSPSHWAYDDVKEVVEDYQIMKGYNGGNFAGYKNLTRYELASTISNMIKFYNQEFTADREDLTSLANIMEQFQEELRIVEARMLNLYRKVGSVERALNVDVADLKENVADNSGDIGVMQESGFILDKLVKGTARDIKHVAYGFSHKSPKERRLEREADLKDAEDALELQADTDVAGQLIESRTDTLPNNGGGNYLIEQ